MRSILHMYCQRCTSKGSPSKKPQNWKFNERQQTEWKECRKDMRRKQWRERKENKEEEKKNGGPRGCPPVRCRHKFSKRKKKINKRMNEWKEQRRNNGPCSVCIWTFTKFLWGIFKHGVKVWAELYYNSNIPTHNTLEFGGYHGQPFAKQLHLW